MVIKMWTSTTGRLYFSLCVIYFLVRLCKSQGSEPETIDMNCDPRMHHRYDDCPDGYCCVRDEFLPTFVYCKKIGIKDDNCSTRTSESDCPCMEGLDCKPNIKSATFVSLYGKCVNATEEESDDMF